MGVEGVDPHVALEVVVESFRGCERRHPVVHRTHLLRGRAVLLGEHFVMGTSVALRDRGIELEAAPHGLDRVRVVERLERPFPSTLADVAPRACDVRPDLDDEVPHPHIVGAAATEAWTSPAAPRDLPVGY
jgi:hypothetical protein